MKIIFFLYTALRESPGDVNTLRVDRSSIVTMACCKKLRVARIVEMDVGGWFDAISLSIQPLQLI